MLRSYSQHRSSPTASPIFQHAPAPAQKSIPGSPLSRRPSQSRVANLPAQPRVRYVDTGTQWSPPMIEKMEAPRAESTRVGIPRDEAEPAEPIATVPFVPTPSNVSPPKPLVPPESPGMKKRPSEPPVSVPANAVLRVVQKRSKLDQRPVKILPLKYEFCAVEDMVVLIANMIQELINTNDSLPLRSAVLTRFHSRTPPGISVLDYLQRLAKHATLTPPILLSMVYYIDRLCLLYPAFSVNSLTVHRFLITAATVAAKGLSDSFWNNTTYARVGGIKVAELGLLELDFLYRVDWKIVPNPEALVDYYHGLIERSDYYELDDDLSTSEEEDGDEEDVKMEKDLDESHEGATNEKWKTWMNDVKEESKSPNDEKA